MEIPQKCIFKMKGGHLMNPPPFESTPLFKITSYANPYKQENNYDIKAIFV